MAALARRLASWRCKAAFPPHKHAMRTFSTTQDRRRQTPTHHTVPAEQVADYPYGPFRWSKQRNTGLYGTAKIRTGNTVTPKKGKVNLSRSVTHWKPNRQMKRLWSPALNMFVRTRLTTQVLKTIDKLGGIDEYLLGSKQMRIKALGPAGWRLRWKLIQSPVIQARWARERAALGLPPRPTQVDALEGAPSVADMKTLDGVLARQEVITLGGEQNDDRQSQTREATSSRLTKKPRRIPAAGTRTGKRST